jgi:NTE family protein
MNKVKYGLVLSGGGARCYAHIGVLKALHELGIAPGVVAGTSAGAIAGAFYCDGKHPDEIHDIFRKNDVNGSINLMNLVKGFLKHDNLKRVLDKYLSAKNFSELKYPLFVNAADYTTAKEIVFSEGTIADKIIASATIPVIFEPVQINGIPYVDGGIANNLPAQAIRPFCEVLIGVHVNPVNPWTQNSGFLENLDRALNMAILHTITPGKSLCDVFIEPPAVAKYQMFGTGKLEEIVNIGYNYTKTILSTTAI